MSRFALAVAAVVGVFILVLFAALFLLPQALLRTPTAWQRGQENDAAGGGAGATLAGQAGKLNAQNSLSTAKLSFQSGSRRFAGESLVLINLSDHPLALRVGEALIEELKKTSSLKSIEYFPPGNWPPPGIAAPDLFMTLRMDSLEESGLLLERKMKAEFDATLGTEIARSNHGYSDDLSPIGVQFMASIHLDHSSTFRGVETSSARYTLQAQNIAGELAKRVSDDITEMQDKTENDADTPKGFFASWRETPEFGFVKQFDLQRLTATHGFMHHNETFWRIADVNDAAAVVQAISDALQAEGWTVDQGPSEQANDPHLRMSHGSKMLQVFRVGEGFSRPASGDDAGPRNLCVQYRDRMSREELREALNELFSADPPDVEQLLAFRNLASGDQHEKLAALLQEHAPRSAEGWIALAEYHANKKDAVAARLALVRAAHAALALPDPGSVQSDVKRIAKKLDLQVSELKPVDSEVFRELGFIPLPIGQDVTSPAVEVDVEVGEVARFFLPSESDDAARFHVVAVLVRQLGGSGEQARFSVTTMRSEPNGSRRTSSVSGMPLTSPYVHRLDIAGQELRVKVLRNDDGRIHVTIEPRVPIDAPGSPDPPDA